eukprot:gene7419-5224_t
MLLLFFFSFSLRFHSFLSIRIHPYFLRIRTANPKRRARRVAEETHLPAARQRAFTISMRFTHMRTQWHRGTTIRHRNSNASSGAIHQTIHREKSITGTTKKPTKSKTE